MALLQKAVDEWRFEDFDDPGLPPPLHEIRIAFQSSGMIWSSSIEAKRDADNGGRIGNDLRDFSWGCLDDLKRTGRSRATVHCNGVGKRAAGGQSPQLRIRIQSMRLSTLISTDFG